MNKKQKKGRRVARFVSMALAAALLANQTAALAAPAKGHFTDVPESHWGYSYVEKAYEDGAVGGAGGNAADGTGVFSPDQTLAYAEFAAILTRAFYAESIPAAQAGEPWYEPYLKAGIAKKLLTVDTLDQAMTQARQPISRYDMAEILIKILIDKKVPLPSLEQLSDVNARIADWDEVIKDPNRAYYVSCAYAMDLLKGMDDKGSFLGDETVSRAAAAAVYCRAAEAVRPSASPIQNVEDLKKLPGIDRRCNADGLFQLKDNWYYSTASGEKDEYIEGIFSSLYPQYVAIFGQEAMSYKPVVLYNQPEAPNPVTLSYEGYTIIKLSLNKTSLWSQMIFQLSHEMTHYAFYSLTPNATIEKGDWDDLFSEWNEEIICEGMSLYMLGFLSENWAACPLAKINQGYGASIEKYWKDIYDHSKDRSLLNGSRSVSGSEFKALSDAADENRSQHGAERNYCCDLFVKYGNNVIGEVLDMYRYYNPRFSDIDFEAWAKNARNADFIQELSRIQPEVTAK